MQVQVQAQAQVLVQVRVKVRVQVRVPVQVRMPVRLLAQGHLQHSADYVWHRQPFSRPKSASHTVHRRHIAPPSESAP